MKVRLWKGGQGWGKRDCGSGFSPRQADPWSTLGTAQGHLLRGLESSLCSARGSIWPEGKEPFPDVHKGNLWAIGSSSSLVDGETEVWGRGQG